MIQSAPSKTHVFHAKPKREPIMVIVVVNLVTYNIVNSLVSLVLIEYVKKALPYLKAPSEIHLKVRSFVPSEMCCFLKILPSLTCFLSLWLCGIFPLPKEGSLVFLAAT